MKILMVSAEAVPFAKTGGLADAVSALSIVLSSMGHDVKIVIPRYYKIDRSKLTKLEGPMAINAGTSETWSAVYKTQMPGCKSLEIYFIDQEQCFGRDAIYGNKVEPDFSDNTYRFSVLCHGAFQLCRKLNWYPDIIHAHDWSAGIAPVILKHLCRADSFANTASVFTIHNMGYQGRYSKDQFPSLGLPWNLYYGANYESYGGINLMQAAISSADMITTVSPTYAREIQTPEGGFGLDGLLRVRSDVIRGIVNGVDDITWNPQTDTYLPANYSSDSLKNKAVCKAALQKKMGLPVNPDIPVIGMVTRLVDQKGVGCVFGPSYGCLFNICTKMNVQVVLLGSGDRWYENEIHTLDQNLPNFKAIIGYEESLSHLIEAGSDFFLMPSKYEPCGLNQMYSLLYGTLPIVHRTGGLADTVKNYNEETGEGTGFMFDYLSPQAIFDTVGWAVFAYYNKKNHIKAMQKRGMESSFGWRTSAEKYVETYKEALVRGCGIK